MGKQTYDSVPPVPLEKASDSVTPDRSMKRVLGIDHPLTRKVAAGFLRCFDEQLDWSLDDIPYERLAYRARLLGE